MGDRSGQDTDIALRSTTIRALTASESVFAVGDGVFVGYSVVCTGSLDVSALTSAFIDLQRNRPDLLARILPAALHEHVFVVDGRSPALPRVFEGEDLDGRVSQDDAEFDQCGRLVHLDVLPGPGRHRVTLFVHHSIADAAHGLALLEELWQRYTRHVEGGSSPSPEPEEFPEPIEHFLRSRTHPGATPGDGMLLSAELLDAINEAPRPPLRPVLPHRLRLSERETRGLLEFGHAQNLTLNAIISAAILRVHREPGAPYVYAVDLRSRIDPPISRTEATTMLGYALFDGADPDGSLPALARQVADQLAIELANGLIHERAVSSDGEGSASLTASLLSEGPISASTNWGRVPRLQTPAGLNIVDFQSFSPPSALAVVLTDILHRPLRTYVISTFDSQLSIEFTAGPTPPGGEQLLARIGVELRAAIDH